MGTIATLGLWLYLAPLVIILGLYVGLRERKKRRFLALRDEALKAGLTEPASLHPAINHNRCLGCGSCVNACPEQPDHAVLGVIGEKAQLINPTDCIGHGACKTACPADAITLVFGTETRGVDIPLVSPDFETNVPGIFIAGELGGMGLIRNAVEQGRQAMDSIAGARSAGNTTELDVLIVGAGPAGFSATLAAKKHALRYSTVEQDSLGGTVYHYPRGKIVMTAPAELPLVGKIRFKETTKEALLGFWQKVERDTGVKINYGERVEEITETCKGFTVKTTVASYDTRTVLLAIGRRGTPRKLGVPGEGLPKVVYRLIDPQQYRGRRVLVVGGGDSALESAVSISKEEGTSVTLSYRSPAFTRAKENNRRKVQAAAAEGRLRILMSSNVTEIKEGAVVIEQEGKSLELENDAVIVNAGGILPTAFLKKVGIGVETKYGAA